MKNKELEKMLKEKFTTIQVTRETKGWLDKFKLGKNEPYEEVVKRILKKYRVD
jgi:hypothetical protein